MAAAKPRTPRVKFHFVSAGHLDCVELDEDERTKDASTLLELLMPPLGDPVLETLRKSLSMTYAGADLRQSEQCIRDIRAMAITTLGELGEELEKLRLSRVDADPSYKRDESAKVFMYLIVATGELRRRVTVAETGRRAALRDVIPHTPADDALRSLRRVLSLTFEEATTPTQHDRILEDIRFVAAEALAPCNGLLESIELEPVTIPSLRRFVDGVDTYTEEEDSTDDLED